MPLIKLPPATLPAVILPATLKLVNVPTLVKLLLTILEFNVVPVKLAALLVIATLLAAVNWPWPLTVNVATRSPLPYDPLVTIVSDMLIVVPVILIPVPPVYVWLVLNTLKTILLVPKVIVPLGALTTKAVPLLTLPPVVKK